MVQVITAKNGVRIVAEQMPHVRSLSVGVWVNAGSRYETPEENGITHFIEHMLFKGTKNRTARQIAEQFDRIGGEINAFTSKENTCYFAKVLDHHGEIAITILADMFFNSLFSQEDIERERQVVLEEIYMSEDDPADDVHEKLWAVMYPNDALGRPILGTAETLETFDEAMIRTYMAKHYGPKNVVISIAGNIEEGLLEKIEALFGTYEASSKSIVSKPSYPEFTAGEVEKTRDTEQAHIAISFPAINVKDPQMYSFVALNNIIGGNMSSRLFQDVREDRGLAYSVFSFQSSFEDVGAFTIAASASKQNLDALKQQMDQTLFDVVAGGVTEEELENAKEQLKGSFVLGLEGTEDYMNRNGVNELIHQNHRTVDEVLAKIDAISMDSMDDLITKILLNEPAIAIIGPENE
ncbi:peptidase M16 [Lysinibacillus sp. 2017]|uniref:M16 family metallopeptidase n=1 Tax=unclassified Lysinibacillus TaxID=2636778 RepID=UPI000D525C35|nr:MULTISPECIES: pitrilysin family protein [unclassified Lysinibacillus]AWE06723.1 peptidase M16 [Lysinibacillus sp. 2017]TGN37344.1 insulinase family protein [Lysinibacillus sp. S2017]